MAQVEAIEKHRYHWRTIKAGDRLPTDDPAVRANPSKFKAVGGGGGRPADWIDAPDGGPGNPERWQKYGIPPRR